MKEILAYLSSSSENIDLILDTDFGLIRTSLLYVFYVKIYVFIYIMQGQEKLSQFLRWAVTTAIQSKSGEMLQTEDSEYHFIAVSGKNPPEESLASKLLRWLTAAAIVGKISSKLSKVDDDSFLERESLHSLLSWLGSHEKGLGENSCYGCDDVLAASIFYLLQLLGFSHSLLPLAGSALCLLLLSDSSGSF